MAESSLFPSASWVFLILAALSVMVLASTSVVHAQSATTATMSVAYAVSPGYDFNTTISISNGDGLYPYYLNVVFQNATGSDIFTQTLYTNKSAADFGWTFSELRMQAGKNYSVMALVIDKNGKYLARSNQASIYLSPPSTLTTISPTTITPTTIANVTVNQTTTIPQTSYGQSGTLILAAVVVIIIILIIVFLYLRRPKPA